MLQIDIQRVGGLVDELLAIVEAVKHLRGPGAQIRCGSHPTPLQMTGDDIDIIPLSSKKRGRQDGKV